MRHQNVSDDFGTNNDNTYWQEKSPKVFLNCQKEGNAPTVGNVFVYVMDLHTTSKDISVKRVDVILPQVFGDFIQQKKSTAF